VIDGVFTIPLFADFHLDEFESAAASNGEAERRKHVSQRVNGDASGSFSTTCNVADCEVENSLVVGPENRTLAEAVGSLLYESPSPFNPMVLCGPPGTGKSHVARGLAGHWRDQSRPVVYVTGADYARGLATAIERRGAAAWRTRQRSASLFVLEEIAQLAGKQAALAELLHTIDAVCGRNGQVVVTSRLPLDRLPAMPEALVARLVGGLVLQIAPPGTESRLKLVERFAAMRGEEMPAAAVRQLADGLAVTAPELFGAVTELSVQAKLDGDGITPDRVRRFLAERRGAVRPTVRSIASLSAKYFGLKVAELTSPTRRRAVVQARNVAIYLSRQLAGKSLEQLGKFFGDRDHTTILHGYRTIESRSRTDPEVRQALSELRKMLAHG
jgi:chromosomal replication initiator protein